MHAGGGERFTRAEFRAPGALGAMGRRRAFTLVELLVVIGIIVILIGLVISAVSGARRAAQRSACLAAQQQIGVAIAAYAAQSKSRIPYGPTARPVSASDLYPATGNVTNLISIQFDGSPVGIGLMIPEQLANIPRVVFCPASDDPTRSDSALARYGKGQSQSDFYYRHGSSISLSDATTPPRTDHIRLSNLGLNRNNQPIRALLMDQNYIAHPSLAAFGVFTRTCHDRRTVNVLYSDGHAVTISNRDGRFTIDPGPNIYDSFSLILAAFERADVQ